jgi:hypothetical protein
MSEEAKQRQTEMERDFGLKQLHLNILCLFYENKLLSEHYGQSF